ncbi:hypothetical protein Vretimale_6473 [Volvox reticuliferus]|uniref:Sugar phosphate transporter domain-containing protein n=1 Tax=Volvox reticuliferus TaxID=1737510 RepID=A0A8J4G7S5_9CHLO|nr:hypothetical protein Vretifemale_19973 [Volvox reticuliferus]GIM01674.1 hypothetical protein Vretimale_6473 [Volvox reticuliferus]
MSTMHQRDDLTERARPRETDDDVKVEWGLSSPSTLKSPSFRGGSLNSNHATIPRRVSTALLRTRLGLQLLTIAACLSWMTASSWAILVNKHIMVNLKFPYPCTIAWMGLLTTTIASYSAIRLKPVALRLVGLTAAGPSTGAGGVAALSGGALSSGGSGGTSMMTAVTPRYYLTRVLPTGFFMALTFQTGNMGYLYLTVAFVQMLKAFCPVVTMILLFVAQLETASRKLVAAVTLIAVGVALASYGELNMSLIGLTAMLISVVAESVRLVMTQYLLVAGGGGSLNPMEGLFYISSACTAVLAVQASYMEWPQLVRQRHYLAVQAHPYNFAAAACCGFLVNMLAISVIKLASSLTLKVLGTVKDAALVTIGIVFLHEKVTSLQLLGYTISMVGFVSYNLIKAAVQHRHLGGGGALGGLVGGGISGNGVAGSGSAAGGTSAVRSLLPYYTINANASSSKTR